MATTLAPPPMPTPERTANRQKFEVELEFVQSLASPKYLHELARSRVLYEEAFVNYLEYLGCWAEPEYARFLTYPSALRALELLKVPAFREHLAFMDMTDALINDNEILWNTWRESEATRLAREAHELARLETAARAAESEAERRRAQDDAKRAMEVAKKEKGGPGDGVGVGGGSGGVGSGEGRKRKASEALSTAQGGSPAPPPGTPVSASAHSPPPSGKHRRQTSI